MAEAKRKVVADTVSNMPQTGGNLVYVHDDGNNVRQLLHGLANFDQGMQKYFTDKVGEMAAGDAAKDFAAGRSPQQSHLTAYMKAYNKLDAAARANEMHLKLSEMIADPNTTAIDLEKAQNDMLNHYLKDRDEDFAANLMPQALNVFEHANGRFQALTLERLKVENTQKMGAVMRTDIDAIFQNTAPTDRAKAYRNLLSKAQENYKGLGFTRQEISQQFGRIMGQYAEEKTDPTLFDYADEKDASGISVKDNPELAQEVHVFRNQAETARNKADVRLEKLKNEREKQITNDILSVLALQDGSDLKALKAVKQQIIAYSNPERNPEQLTLDPSTVGHLWAVVDKLETLDGFRAKSVQSTFRHLYAKDDLSLEEVNAASYSLSKEDYVMLINRVNREGKLSTTKEGRRYQQFIKDGIADGLRQLAPYNAFTGVFEVENGAERAQTFRLYVARRIEEEQQKGNSEIVPLETVSKIITEGIKHTEATVPKTERVKTPNIGGGPAQASEGGSQKAARPPKAKKDLNQRLDDLNQALQEKAAAGLDGMPVM